MPPEVTQTINFAPLAVAALGVFLPLFVVWKVEGGDGARAGAVLAVAPAVLVFGLIGIGVLSWRADRNERRAM
jgi:hypothetical protein